VLTQSFLLCIPTWHTLSTAKAARRFKAVLGEAAVHFGLKLQLQPQLSQAEPKLKQFGLHYELQKKHNNHEKSCRKKI